ncbi:hypothetical protein RYX36_001987 [Vicia faba]
MLSLASSSDDKVAEGVMTVGSGRCDDSSTEKVGTDIVKRALSYHLKLKAKNAGVNEGVREYIWYRKKIKLEGSALPNISNASYGFEFDLLIITCSSNNKV